MAIVGIAGLCLLMVLTLRYSRQTLTAAREQASSPVGPPPVDVERIERYQPPAAPPDAELSRPTEPPVQSNPFLPASRQRSQELDAALRSQLVHRTGTAPAEPNVAQPDQGLASLQEILGPHVSSPFAPPAIARAGDDGGVATASPARRRNLLPPPGHPEGLLAVRQPPASPYLLRAGAWLPVVLAHRVVSDQPGLLRAVVTRDVRDSLTGRHLLVPRGSVLLGSQGDLPAVGQDRLAVVWHRMQFPDGTSLDIAGDGGPLPSASLDGSAGVRGATDHHWGRRFGAAALLSLVGAGLQLSQPERSLDRAATPGETAAGAAGLELGRLSQSILRQYADLPPTIELRPGARLYAVVTTDLAFDSPYPN